MVYIIKQGEFEVSKKIVTAEKKSQDMTGLIGPGYLGTER